MRSQSCTLSTQKKKKPHKKDRDCGVGIVCGMRHVPPGLPSVVEGDAKSHEGIVAPPRGNTHPGAQTPVLVLAVLTVLVYLQTAFGIEAAQL